LSPGIQFPYYDGVFERTSPVFHPGSGEVVYNFAEPISAKHEPDRLHPTKISAEPVSADRLGETRKSQYTGSAGHDLLPRRLS
jgi:hypothetical protein